MLYRKFTLDGKLISTQTVKQKPILLKTAWPLWAKTLAKLAKPEDKGLGDVIERVIGHDRSIAFKAWYKATFKVSCGCQGRKDKLNKMYPLPPPKS